MNVVKRWILRLAVFCAAASSATAGLALAAGSQDAPMKVPAPAPDVDPDRAQLPTPVADPTDPTEAAPAPWPTRVEARLAALQPLAGTLDPSAPVQARPDRKLAADLEQILHEGDSAPRGRVSVHVRDLDNGRVLVDEHGDRPLNPASNHKILTALAALELLGADYRFETRLAVVGDRLYVVGEGDPSLLLDDVHELVADLVAAGHGESVREIVVDDHAFSERHFGPGYDAEGDGASYMAPSGALSVNFNTVEVITRPDAHGDPEVVVMPPSTMTRVDHNLRVGRRHLDVATSTEDGRTVVRVRGSLPAVHAPVVERRRIGDPGLFTGGVVAAELARQLGESAVPVVRGRVPEGPQVRIVARHRSAPLPQVLASAMKYSNNFTTEQVLRTVGWRRTGRPGSWSDGVDAVQRYWQAVGHDPEAFEFINGSGLNRDGRATTRALVDLVARAVALDGDAKALDAIMARSGGEGTLHYRLGALRDRVRAKTGTMAGVSALSGTVTSRNGQKRLAFSVLVNGGETEDARRVQDQIVKALAAYADRRG